MTSTVKANKIPDFMRKGKRQHLALISAGLLILWSALYPFFHSQNGPANQAEHFSQGLAEPVPDFSQYTRIRDKKRAFFHYLSPVVDEQNQQILLQRTFLLAIRDKLIQQQRITSQQSQQIRRLASDYDIDYKQLTAKVVGQLLTHVDIIPKELVLVQAANESAWGTSRFARQGYNFFGLWCFKKGCGFVPNRRNDGAVHEVAKFSNLSEGVAYYLRNLNRHYAYNELRKIRSVLREKQQPITAVALAEGLISYSERGQAYIDELQAMVRINKAYME